MATETSYFAFGGVLDQDQFALQLEFDRIDDEGRLVFVEKNSGNEFRMNSDQIREFHQDNLMCDYDLVSTNKTPLIDAGQNVSDAVTSGDISISDSAATEIMDAGKILFRTEVRRLRSL